MTKLLMPHISENFRSSRARTSGSNWRKTWHVDRKMHSKFCDALPVIDAYKVDLEEYFKFTVVRNPYSWILSVWNNFYQSPMGNAKKTLTNNLKFKLGQISTKKLFTAQYFYEMYPDGSFENFILFIDRIVSEYPELAPKIWGCSDQYSFIENDRCIKFDFIGKFETIEKDLRTISQIVGKENVSHLPCETHGSDYNKKDRKNYLKYYSDRSIKIVNKLFARDFDFFGYQPILNLADLNTNNAIPSKSIAL